VVADVVAGWGGTGLPGRSGGVIAAGVPGGAGEGAAAADVRPGGVLVAGVVGGSALRA
jgi:hypothetical protein